MRITDINNKLCEQGVDDFDLRKEDNKIKIGYFNECPADMIIIIDGYISSITMSRWERTEWMFLLMDNKTFIEDDYFDNSGCFNCKHGLDIESETEFECEHDNKVYFGEHMCIRYAE